MSLRQRELETCSSPDGECREVGARGFVPSRANEYKARSTVEMESVPWNMVAVEVPMPAVVVQDVSDEPENVSGSQCHYPNRSHLNYPCNSTTDNESGSQTKATRVTDHKEFTMAPIPASVKQKIFNFSNAKCMESVGADGSSSAPDSKRYTTESCDDETNDALIKKYDSLKKQYMQ